MVGIPGRHLKVPILVAGLLLVLAACSTRPDPGSRLPPEGPDPAAIFSRYDSSGDGVVTRAEMEHGLKSEFDKIDVNRNGCLSPEEVRSENERRWRQDASMTSPIIDWKQEGCVDFDAYATTLRSLFEQLDSDGDGQLSADELRKSSRKPGPVKDHPASRERPDGDDN